MNRITITRLGVILLFTLLSTGCLEMIFMRAVMETHRDADKNYAKAEMFRKNDEIDQAFKYYRLAANGHHPQGAYILATYYMQGIGTNVNYRLARRYFDLAVRLKDNVDAYLQLARIDFYGIGRPPAVIQGYKWMLIATRADLALREQYQIKMDPEMTPAYHEKAREFARSWLYAHDRLIENLD